MEELEIALGQRTLPSVHGEQTTATAYAGLGNRHLIVLADGGVGQVPSRLAAQIATSAVIARFRASVFPRTFEQLQEAVAEAHLAVRRGVLGSPAEGLAGTSLLAVVVEPGGVVAARVGGGRVYILTRDTRRSLFKEEGHGAIGAEPVAQAEIVRDDGPLPPGSRIVCATEAVARATAADLDHLAFGPPAQLAAARLTDAARRRGQYEPLAAQVCEVQRTPERDGPHPALARIDRESSRTLSADGRWIGPTEPTRGRARPRGRDGHQEAGGGGWLLWFALAALLGAGAALIAHAPADAPLPEPVVTAPALPPTPPPTPSLLPDAGPTDAAEPDAAPAAPVALAHADDIAALFADPHPVRAARAVRNYITKRWVGDGEQVFADLEAWIAAHEDPAIFAALLELMKDQDLKRTHKWVSELLPRLYARTPSPPDATP